MMACRPKVSAVGHDVVMLSCLSVRTLSVASQEW